MAIPILANDIVEVRAYYDFNSQRVLNVLHYKATGSTTQGDFSDVATAMNTVLTGANGLLRKINQFQDVACVHAKTEYQTIFPVRTVAVVKTGLGGGTNPGFDAPLPQNLAAVITKKGVLAGRSRTGSIHIAGMKIVDVENGILTAGTFDALNDIAQDLRTVVAATGGFNMQPIIFNRTVANQSQNIESAAPQATVRVMRRRTVGVGQ